MRSCRGGAFCAIDHAVEQLYSRRTFYRLTKRLFDIVFSLCVLISFSGLYLLITVAIKIENPCAPVIFKQTRIGKDGHPFTIFKFRTMCEDAENQLARLRQFNEKTEPLFKIKNDPRITPVGRFLRKLSLDELPQFVNVLKGDLSVVGPRPMLPEEIAFCSSCQRRRLLIRQGITCFWQTRRNRDVISFDEQMSLDLLYLKKCGLWTDGKLIIQTIGCVLMAQGS